MAKNNVVGQIFGLLIGAYFIGVTLAFPYFNWCYAHERGFASWVLLGEVVATAQSFCWPYYALPKGGSTLSNSDNNELQPHLRVWLHACSFSEEAYQILERTRLAGQAERTDLERVCSLLQQAVSTGRNVDAAALNRIYPRLGDHFVNDWLTATEMRLDALEHHKPDKIKEANKLIKRYINWQEKNFEALQERCQEIGLLTTN